MKKKAIALCVALATILGCFGGCGASDEKLSKVDDAYQFIVDAAKKTAEAKNISVESGEVGYSEDSKFYMRQFNLNIQGVGSQYACELMIGSIHEEDKEITQTCQNVNLRGAVLKFYQRPLNIAMHENLAKYVKADSEVTSSGNGVRYVSCMMTWGDCQELMSDCVHEDTQPVNVRLYVNSKGYLCEVQIDKLVSAEDGSKSGVYTDYYKFSNFDKKSILEGWQDGMKRTSEAEFPKAKDASSLSAELLEKTYPTYTIEDMKQYEGLVVGQDNSCSVAVRKDGKVVMDVRGEQTIIYDILVEVKNEVEQWTDITYIDMPEWHEGVIGVKKDGTIVMAGFDGEEFASWNTSAFTDIKAVYVTQSTLYGLKNDGTVVVTGKNSVDVSSWKNVQKMSIEDMGKGETAIVALKTDGTVYTSADYGIAEAEKWTDIVDVAMGRFHVVGLKSDGTVVTVGENPLGEEGEHDVQNWTDIVAVAAGNQITMGIRKDGTVVASGYNSEDLVGWTDVVYIHDATNMKQGVRSDGRLYSAYATQMIHDDVYGYIYVYNPEWDLW